jgi:acetoin utilization deacetylase AcuC-like enzyme
MKIGLIQLVHADRHQAPPGHPENPRRMNHALEYVLKSDIKDDIVEIQPEQVNGDCIFNIHDKTYLEEAKSLCEHGGGYLDSDTYATAGSFKAAWETASAAIFAVDAIIKDRFRRIFLAGRPPGHHAERSHGMGFCIINNAAIAAESLIANHGAKKVAIVDWDVHHGNGTQNAFYDRCDVFYISMHRYPFYPGSGAAAQRGTGNGEGLTLNIPLPGGADDETYQGEFIRKIIPGLEDYKPEFIIISCGFDAHRDDPLGGMNMTEHGLGAMTRMLVDLAKTYSSGKILSLFEGGYNPTANGQCLYHHLRELQKD